MRGDGTASSGNCAGDAVGCRGLRFRRTIRRQQAFGCALQQDNDGEAEDQCLEVTSAAGQARNPVVELIAQHDDEELHRAAHPKATRRRR